MCGIAGYNMSKELAGNVLTEERQFDVLSQAWLHNQHRGTDAAGYFRVDLEDSKTYIKKTNKPASLLLSEQTEKAVSPAHVLGAHTRAATLGSPEDNGNNHPVQYGNVIVTHNGMINNHAEFKMAVPIKARQSLPEVDTIAIPITLAELPGPDNVDDIGDLLADLRGGMAVHAVWNNRPGESLLFKGKHSPMYIRWHEKMAIVTYASVDEANFAMIEAMGLDPNEEGWQCRSLDEQSLFVVNQGVITKWGRFGGRAWGGFNKLPYTVKRYHQPMDEVVFESDLETYWAADFRDRTLKDAIAASRVELIWSKKKGWRGSQKDLKMPVTNQQKPYDKIVEADRAYKHKTAPIIYAVFGPTTVLIDQNTSRLLDVQTNQELNRWIIEEKPRAGRNLDWQDWVTKATTALSPTLRVTQTPTPAFMKSQIPLLFGGGSERQLPANRRTASATKRERKGSLDPDKIEVIDLDREIGWHNVNDMIQHKTEPMMWFQDITCPDHSNLKYSEHSAPDTCERAVMASISAFSAFADVSLWYLFEPHTMLVSRAAKDDADKSQCEGPGKGCDWYGYLWRQIHIGDTKDGKHQVMEVLVGDMCSQCGAKSFIRQLPEWLELYVGEERLYVA